MNLRAGTQQLGWWCGIVGTLLLFVGFTAVDAGGTTPASGSIAILVDEIVPSRGRIMVGSMLGMVGGMVLVFLGASLRSRLALYGSRGLVTGRIASSFATIAATGALIHGTYRLSLTSITDPRLLAEAMRPLAILGSHTFDVFTWGLIGITFAMSVGGAAFQLLPRPMIVIGVLLCLGTVALMPTDHGGVGIGLLPWLLIACVYLLRRQDVPHGT